MFWQLIILALIAAGGIVLVVKLVNRKKSEAHMARRVHTQDAPQEKPKRQAQRKFFKTKQCLPEPELESEPFDEFEDDTVRLITPRREPKSAAPAPQVPDTPELPHIAILLMPKQAPFLGHELLQALLAHGLRFGNTQRIFHYYQDNNAQKRILFSLASITPPGTFDLNDMDSHTHYVGLALFMKVHGNPYAQEAFKAMLKSAQGLCEDLRGKLLDHQKAPLTNVQVLQWQAQLSQKMTESLFD